MPAMPEDLPKQISDFKKHPLFPFADFRTNDASFLLLELFWNQVVREAIGDELFSKCEPLQEIERDNGDLQFYDPVMIDFWIPEIDRGARVMLKENPYNFPTLDKAVGDERFTVYYPFGFYLRYDRRTSYDEHEFTQLVCRPDMSDNAIASTQELMRQFFVDRVSEDVLEGVVNKRLEELRNTPNFPTDAEWEDYYARKPQFSTWEEMDAYYRQLFP